MQQSRRVKPPSTLGTRTLSFYLLINKLISMKQELVGPKCDIFTLQNFIHHFTLQVP